MTPRGLPRPSVAAAMLCSGVVTAQFIAGKATRDALFLTSFNVSALPLVLMASALLSIGAVLLTARGMASRGPIRVIPPLFLASSVLLIAEWLLAANASTVLGQITLDIKTGDAGPVVPPTTRWLS